MKSRWLAPVTLVAAAPSFGADVYLTEAQAVQSIFPEATSSTRLTFQLTTADAARVSDIVRRGVAPNPYPYVELQKAGALLGRVFFLEVTGQSQPISFAVGIDTSGKVRGLEVMVYRETHGSEIRSRRFLRQFTGKRTDDALVLDRDVDAISGATISSRSAAYAVKKALALCTRLNEVAPAK